MSVWVVDWCGRGHWRTRFIPIAQPAVVGCAAAGAAAALAGGFAGQPDEPIALLSPGELRSGYAPATFGGPAAGLSGVISQGYDDHLDAIPVPDPGPVVFLPAALVLAAVLRRRARG